jgi:hypothetical protein
MRKSSRRATRRTESACGQIGMLYERRMQMRISSSHRISKYSRGCCRARKFGFSHASNAVRVRGSRKRSLFVPYSDGIRVQQAGLFGQKPYHGKTKFIHSIGLLTVNIEISDGHYMNLFRQLRPGPGVLNQLLTWGNCLRR